MLSELPLGVGFGLLRMAWLPIIRPAFQVRNAALIANLVRESIDSLRRRFVELEGVAYDRLIAWAGMPKLDRDLSSR